MTAVMNLMPLQPYRADKDCPECDGEGEAYYEVKRYGGPPGYAYSPYEEVKLTCQKCDGTGEYIEEEGEEDE